jgi:hypothetical protein
LGDITEIPDNSFIIKRPVKPRLDLRLEANVDPSLISYFKIKSLDVEILYLRIILGLVVRTHPHITFIWPITVLNTLDLAMNDTAKQITSFLSQVMVVRLSTPPKIYAIA